MKKTCLVFAILMLCHACVFAQTGSGNAVLTAKENPRHSTRAVDVNLDSLMLDSAIVAYKNAYSIPGIATLIMKDGEVIWNTNYGYRNKEQQLPVEDSTIFDIASISKTFVATCVMRLVQQGLIHLNSNIDNYLPTGLTVSNPYFPGDSITMKMLLTHTSSLGADGSGFLPLSQCGDSPVRLDSFFAEYLTSGGRYYSPNNYYNYRPGSHWNYCNVDLALAALAVEHVTGKPFHEYCRDSVFLPLSMNSSSWFLNETNQANLATPYEGGLQHCHMGSPIYPAGALRTNKLDMAKYLLAYVNYGKSGEVRILDSSSVYSMISDQVGYTADFQPPWWRLTQGLTWYQLLPINSSGWAAAGSLPGGLSLVVFDPQEKWLTIWFQNFRPIGSSVGNIAEINKVFTTYAHFHGNIYALRPTVNKSFAGAATDSVLFQTTFSNMANHPFTPHLVYTNLDSTETDSLTLFDDGQHGDLLPNDEVYGAYVPITQHAEEFYSLGVSTIDNTNGKYFNTPNIAGFTTAGPVAVARISFEKGYGDYYRLKFLVRNDGATKTVKNVSVRLRTTENWITSISPSEVPIPDIPPGTTVESTQRCTASFVDSLRQDSLRLEVEVMSDGCAYWTQSRVFMGTNEIADVPLEYKLEQNYPNPFNPTTTISYELSANSFVSLKVYDVLGREVKTLVNEIKRIGRYEVQFDAAGLASGVYFCRITAGTFRKTTKLVLLK